MEIEQEFLDIRYELQFVLLDAPLTGRLNVQVWKAQQRKFNLMH